MKAKPIGSAMAAIFFVRFRPTQIPTPISGITPAMMRRMMPKGSASSETRSRATPATRNTTVRTAITTAVVTVMSNGLMGGWSQIGQAVRKSGGHTFGANVGVQRCPFRQQSRSATTVSPETCAAPIL